MAGWRMFRTHSFTLHVLSDLLLIYTGYRFLKDSLD